MIKNRPKRKAGSMPDRQLTLSGHTPATTDEVMLKEAYAAHPHDPKAAAPPTGPVLRLVTQPAKQGLKKVTLPPQTGSKVWPQEQCELQDWDRLYRTEPNETPGGMFPATPFMGEDLKGE